MKDNLTNNKPYERYQTTERMPQEKINTSYENFRDYYGVERLFIIGDNSPETELVIQRTKAIQDFMNAGVSYKEAFAQLGGSDSGIENLALRIVAEEQFKTYIKSSEQWQTLGKMGAEYTEKIEFSFNLGSETLYCMALEKVLVENGNFKNLLAIDPQSFGLPLTWKNASGHSQNKYLIIRSVLKIYIEESLSAGLTIAKIIDQLQLPDEIASYE